MPSPITHVAAGVAIARVWRGRNPTSEGTDLATLAVCLGFSLLPDLDAALGIFLGNLGRYHNNMAGSPVFGALVAGAIGAIVRLVRPSAARRAFWLALVCYQLHVLMDFFTVGRGLMMLWPLTDERYSPPFHLFYGVRWSDGLFSERHLITIATETVSVALLYLLLRGWLRLRRG